MPWGQIRDPALRAGQIPHTPYSEYKVLCLKGTSKALPSGQVRDPTISLFSMDIHTTKINNLFMCLLNINIALLNNNLGDLISIVFMPGMYIADNGGYRRVIQFGRQHTAECIVTLQQISNPLYYSKIYKY